MDQELKKSLIMASLMTAALIVLAIAASLIIGLAVAPEQAKLAPKQVEDNEEAYQVARGANIGVIRTWLFIGTSFSILLVWVLIWVRYALNKDKNEEPLKE